MIERGDCPSENELAGFLEGGLPDTDRVRIEAHCAGCERCREGLAHAADESAAIGSPEDTACPLASEIDTAVHGVLGESASVEDAVGQRIGRFEIVAVQGRGQFGVVYRARDPQLGRMVAVKVMRRTRGSVRPILEALFRTEAAAAARLQHPNIVTIHDYGELEGAPYLILELLDGETLRSRLERDSRLAPLLALAIAGDVARALVEAHAAGVIHRDIKPSNVFLCASGQTKVLDLGLAQLHDAERPRAPGSAVPARAGTPQYMAPELFRGHPADECTDVYAVGVMLLETLVGLSPGRGATIEERIAEAPVPPRLRGLLHKATAAERARRFQDAGELLVAVTHARRRLASRRIRLGLAIAGTVAALAATAAVAYHGTVRSERPARPVVAVLGFSNLSGRSDAAWLSTALSEMLDADLAASHAIRVVSPEQVARARADLVLPDSDHLDLRTLQELRRYLAADYVVIGSYVSVASDGGPRTRLDVRIQDTWGLLLDTFSETGDDGALLGLAERIAGRSRVRLVGAASAVDEDRALRTSMPRGAEAVRLYAEGLRRWRGSDLLEARDLLARAVAAEPGFPLAHSALSQVLHLLGEEDRMREEAKVAFDRSGGLAREERLLIEARYREAIDEWPAALALRRVFHGWFPDDLEDGLELCNALANHGEATEARAVIAELRRLPPPWRDDPRIDLYEILVEPTSRVRKALAISSAGKAKAVGARWVLARARLREATADRELGELDHALAAAEEARVICESLHDREGCSIAMFEVGTALALRGEPVSAVIALYEEALRLEREIGNSDQVASMSGNIAYEYLMAGDPARAAPRIDEMERLAKYRARVYAEEYRGIQWLEQGELAAAFAQFERIRQTGKLRGFALKLLGDVLLAQGELAQARARLEQFLAKDWAPDDDLRVLGMLALSRLDVDDGQLAPAEALARQGIAICERTRNESDLGAAQAALARALVAEQRFGEARPMAEAALRLATRLEDMPVWIDARTTLARAAFGLRPRDVDAALAEARAALDRARERGLLGQAYEARLAAGEIAAQAHRAAGRSELRALAADAAAHGFHLIVRKARAATAAPDRAR